MHIFSQDASEKVFGVLDSIFIIPRSLISIIFSSLIQGIAKALAVDCMSFLNCF